MATAELLDDATCRQIERVVRCHYSVRLFAETYLAHHLQDEETGERVPFGPHHLELFELVERPGSDKHVARAEPREHGKSTIMDLVVPLWWLATERKRFIVLVADTAHQAEGHLAAVVEELERNDLLLEDYPHLAPAVDRKGQYEKWTDAEIHCRSGQVVAAVGAGKSIRGIKRGQHRPDAVVVDDLENDEAVATSRQRDKLERWFQTTLLSLGGKGCDFYFLGTILHRDSVLARVIRRAQEEAEAGRVPTWDARVFAAEDEEGRPLWPERWPKERLEARRRAIGSRAYAQEFLNDPARWEGGMFRREWFQVVDDWPRDARTVRYWDQAATSPAPGRDPDWTVGAKVAAKGGQYWVVDIVRTRTTPGGVEELTRQTAVLDGREVPVWIEQEGGASGANTISHYQRDVLAGFPCHGYRPTGSKAARAAPFSSAAEAGNVFLVRGPWLEDFLDEVEAFPEGAHDDQVDAVSGAFAVLFEQQEPPILPPLAMAGQSRWRS